MQQSKQIFTCRISLPGAVTECKSVNQADIQVVCEEEGRAVKREGGLEERRGPDQEGPAELYNGEPQTIL